MTQMALNGQKIQIKLYPRDSIVVEEDLDSYLEGEDDYIPAHCPFVVDTGRYGEEFFCEQECYYDKNKVVNFYNKKFELSNIYFADDEDYPEDWEPIDPEKDDFIMMFMDYSTEELFTIYYNRYCAETNTCADDKEFTLRFYETMKLIDLLLSRIEREDDPEKRDKYMKQIFRIRDGQDYLGEFGFMLYP